MNSPQQYTRAEIKLIDQALKSNWKRKKLIAKIILILMIIIAAVMILQTPLDTKNLREAYPMLLLACVWGSILESYKFFELIKKLAISNVDNDKQKP